MEDINGHNDPHPKEKVDKLITKKKFLKFKEKWLKLVKTVKENYRKVSSCPQKLLTPDLKSFKAHLDLACLNTKDDSYMISSDGKYLIFLTFDDIIKFNIETQKVEVRNSLAPLLFPYLKKMLVRRRDLLLNHNADKILGVIEEKDSSGVKYCFLIYDISKNKAKLLRLKLEPNEKVKEWIIADNWVNEIFYKVEKAVKLKKMPPYGTKKRKVFVIKKYDLRREKSEIFYVCHSSNKLFEKISDEDEVKKCDVEIKHVPFFELGWILILEGLKRKPDIFNLKILDIHNKKILCPIVDPIATPDILEYSRKMNFGYLHLIGNFGMEQLFLRSDQNLYVLEPRIRNLHTVNKSNIDSKLKKLKILKNLLGNLEVKKIRKINIRFIDKENWRSLEMGNMKTNTGLVDIYHFEKKSGKKKKLRICYNNNDRRCREIRIYHMKNGEIMKLSDTPGCSAGGYFTAMNILNLKTKEVSKYCTQIEKDTNLFSGIISVKVDWENHLQVLMMKPKSGNKYKFFVVYHIKRIIREFEIDLGKFRVERDTEFFLKENIFLIWISKFGVYSYNIEEKKLKIFENCLNLGKIFGVMRSNKKLPCFYKDGIRMVRDGISRAVNGVKTKSLNFYNFKTGELDTVFENVPNGIYQWNNYDFLYYLLVKEDNKKVIILYDMETRNQHKIKLRAFEAGKISLLRVDRAKGGKISDEYLVSIYLKIEKKIKNFKIFDNKITKYWEYEDWIPNISRVKFFGEKAYVMLSTVSSYILDDRSIVKGQKREMFEKILERDWEEFEAGFELVEEVYYSFVALTEPFAYFLVKFFEARQLFQEVCDLEIEGKGLLDSEFFGDFEGI